MIPCPGVALSRHARCASGMGNLVRKGFLAFDTSATAYLYSAPLPAEQVAGRLIDEIVAQLWRGDGGPALAHLLGPHLEIRDPGLLAQGD